MVRVYFRPPYGYKASEIIDEGVDLIPRNEILNTKMERKTENYCLLLCTSVSLLLYVQPVTLLIGFYVIFQFFFCQAGGKEDKNEATAEKKEDSLLRWNHQRMAKWIETTLISLKIEETGDGTDMLREKQTVCRDKWRLGLRPCDRDIHCDTDSHAFHLHPQIL